MRIQCFFLEPTGQEVVYLRRYSKLESCKEQSGGYHQAMTFLQKEPSEYDENGYVANDSKPAPAHDDPRWPICCSCGYRFQENDRWQRFTDSLYRRRDTGAEMTLRVAPPGAMWYAWWYDDSWQPQGPHNLVVKTPGGEWNIDSQANNCTMPEDRGQQQHHCWIRHGEPPDVTVDKQGVTCGAGAGSIQCGNYHGFLRNGYLED